MAHEGQFHSSNRNATQKCTQKCLFSLSDLLHVKQIRLRVTAQVATIKAPPTSLLSFSSSSWWTSVSHAAQGWCHTKCIPTAHQPKYLTAAQEAGSALGIVLCYTHLLSLFQSRPLPLSMKSMSWSDVSFTSQTPGWYLCIQRERDTRNLIKAVKMLTVSAFLLLH